MSLRLGVDVGGTFTDVVLYDSDGQHVWLAKTPSTPADQSIWAEVGLLLVWPYNPVAPFGQEYVVARLS